MKKLRPCKTISIEKKNIGLKDPVYFIAEIGSNFDGDLYRAKELIYMAKEAGADAAKFQHYAASSLVSDFGFKSINNSSHQSKWKKSVYETYNDASIEQDWTGILQETCKEAGLSFLTSPYSFDLVDLVDKYVPAYKVGSGDITWIEIIEHMASKGKPILLAIGASNMIDVQRAIEAVLNITPNLIVLQCNTNYTASHDNYAFIQLNVLQELQNMYPGLITGLSDHMPGYTTVLGAVALGARVIEKHFTDSTSRTGPDHAFSMTPNTFREMVDRTRELEDSMGDGYKKVEENEKETVILQRRSVCAKNNLSGGIRIKRQDLTVLRPCPVDGIAPFDIKKIVGRVLNKGICSGQHIKWDDLV
jgi:sialic acid synthase SpsE